MIVIMGILVIPTLYAWFNIAASWDPYGSTDGLKIAVASEDAGYTSELINVDLNLGDDVIKALKENDNFNWVFTDADDAADGVKSGKYYASLVIPEDFTKDMMSVFTSDVTHPQIIYYINEKENAIAPKVTEKGASAVQQQVNDTFIETVSKTALEAIQLVSNAADDEDDQELADKLSKTLNQVAFDLSSAANTVQSFANLTKSGALMLDSTTEFLKQSGSGAENSVEAFDKAGEGIDSLNSALTGTTKTISDALAQNKEFYTAVSDAVGKALDSYNTDAEASADALYAVSDRIQDVIDRYTEIENSLTDIGNDFDSLKILNSAIRDINGLIDTAIARQTAIRDKIITSMFTALNDSVQDIAGVTDNASGDLSDVQKTLEDSVNLLKDASDKLTTASRKVSDSGSMDALTDLLEESPESMASFIASPVKLHENQIYPIENYGSAMAPFYSTLAIWVGAVVMAAMLKVTVSENAKKRLKNPKEHQLYFGRMILMVCLGILQSALICLGDLYFLGIQCEHPLMFIITGCFSSLIYVNIIYALTVSFGDIGKAVAVVLMVMQVAGSGGTFPIECAPKFFQIVYPLLPFVHSMNAMRECIAGFYGNYYMVEMAKMALYLIPSLLLGLLLRKPIVRLNEVFIEKLESTKLM